MKGITWILILIILGICLSGYAVYEIVFSEVKTKQKVEEAKRIINNAESTDGSIAQNDVIGLLSFPKLNSELAIVKGTDPDDLEKGVGHYEGSYMPNENGQIVLSGHRDTVFKRVGELEIGDELVVATSNGSYTYSIQSTKIVDADDTSVITLQNQQEELLLTTCYPFGFIGNAPQRYIIYAKRSEQPSGV